MASIGNDTYVWFCGGYSVTRSTVDRITYATDTDTASVRGPFSAVRFALAAAGTNDYGWFGAGFLGSPGTILVSIVERITYSTDTAAMSTRGPLSLTRRNLQAAGNTTDGWYAGGGTFPGVFSTVDRITYATDTATASVRGPLTANETGAAAGNNTDGWFVGVGAVTTVNRITYATDTATASIRGPISENYYGGGAAGIQ